MSDLEIKIFRVEKLFLYNSEFYAEKQKSGNKKSLTNCIFY